MIKFFRKIRQQLLTENRFSKYLLYAIGEIVLVVIGILIALQINNWNELKKNKATVELIFEDILNDLEYDIQLADKEINYYNRIDSLCSRVLTNKVSIKDYDEGLILMYPYRRFLSDDLSMNAADLLLQKSEIISVQYKDEFNLIKEIYNNDIEDIINYNNQLEKYLIDLQYEYRKNYDWFSGSKEEHLAQNKHFRLNNPKYLNNVALFEKKVEILNASYNVFRTNAIIAYHQIHKKINSLREIPEYIPLFLQASPEELAEYIGSYRFDKNVLKLINENFYLKMQVLGSNNQNIYYIAKDIFVPGLGKNDRFEFKRDSTGAVVSFDIFENGQFLTNAEKIKD